MKTTVVLIVILGVLLALAIYVPRLQVRRAMRNLILLFRKREATDPATAVALEEVGVFRRNAVQQMFKSRDYRPLAARALLQTGIIQATEDGKVYLSEYELERSPLKESLHIE
jgi:hypothetical protein